MKNKMDNILTMSLILFAMVFVFVLPAAAETVSVGSATIAPGGFATVPIQVSDITTNIAATTVTLTFSFDPAVVTVSDVTPGDLKDIFVKNINNSAGTVAISAINATGLTTAPVVIANVVLKAVGAAGSTTPLMLNVIVLVDANGISRLPATIVNGVVDISAQPKGNVTGGGWIVSPITPAPKNNNKATFGFIAHFVNGKDIPGGNLEYTDHVTGMKVLGNVTALSVNKATMTATFSGIAKINGEGSFAYTVTVVDNGEPGKMDIFGINIPGKNYRASARLGGGNIQIQDP